MTKLIFIFHLVGFSFQENVNSQVTQHFHAELHENIADSGKATIMLCDTNGIRTTDSNVEYFLVQVTDTNNNKVIGTTGEIIHGLPNSSAILNLEISDKLTPQFHFKLTPLFQSKLTPLFRCKLPPCFTNI